MSISSRKCSRIILRFYPLLQNHILCVFVANLKIGAIYALYPDFVTLQLSRLDLEYVHPCLSDLYIHMHPHHCLNYQYGILIIIIIVTILLLMITISSRHHCSFDPYSHRPYLVEDSKGQVWRELFL